MNIVHRMATGTELGVALIEIIVNFIDVTILFNCIWYELMKVGCECSDSCLAFKRRRPQDSYVHERGNNLGFSIYNENAVLLLGTQCCLSLLSEAIVKTVIHLLVFCTACLSELMPVMNVLHDALGVLKLIEPYLIIRLMSQPSLLVNFKIFVHLNPIPSCLPCLVFLSQ